MTKIPTNEMIAFVNGTVGPTNPAVYGAWAYLFRKGGDDVKQDSGIVNSHTVSNNAMQYLSAAKALSAYMEMGMVGPLHIVSSSQLVVYQMQGVWSVKQGAYVRVHETVSDLLSRCSFEVHWHWAPQNLNFKAVELSSLKLQEVGVSTFTPKARKPAP